MTGVREAYRQFELRSTPGVTWTLGFISPVAGLADAALLVTAVPDDRKRLVQAWAWWDSGVWIGPRHTSVPNGSICAYEPPDGGSRFQQPAKLSNHSHAAAGPPTTL